MKTNQKNTKSTGDILLHVFKIIKEEKQIKILTNSFYSSSKLKK